MAIETCISIISLNVNRFKAQIKRHRLAEWIQKQDPYSLFGKGSQEGEVREQKNSDRKVGKVNKCKGVWFIQ